MGVPAMGAITRGAYWKGLTGQGQGGSVRRFVTHGSFARRDGGEEDNDEMPVVGLAL